MKEMIETIEDTLKEIAQGRGFEIPRQRIHHPNRMIFGILPGSVHGVMGATCRRTWTAAFTMRQQRYYSVETGEPLIFFKIARSMNIEPVPRVALARNIWRGRMRAESRSSAAPSMLRRN